MSDKFLFTRQEAASAIGVCTKTIDRLVIRGELRTRRIGRRVLIPRASLVRYSASDHATTVPDNRPVGAAA